MIRHAYLVATLNTTVDPPAVSDVRTYGAPASQLTKTGNDVFFFDVIPGTGETYGEAEKQAFETIFRFSFFAWVRPFLKKSNPRLARSVERARSKVDS